MPASWLAGSCYLFYGNLALACRRQLDAATATLHEAIDLLEDSRCGGGTTIVTTVHPRQVTPR